jgi:hypothetical protein
MNNLNYTRNKMYLMIGPFRINNLLIYIER